jgi:hypothetical protein
MKYYVLREEKRTVETINGATETKIIYDPRHALLVTDDLGTAIGYFKTQIKREERTSSCSQRALYSLHIPQEEAELYQLLT